MNELRELKIFERYIGHSFHLNLPSHDLPNHLKAMNIANDIRLHRAELKRKANDFSQVVFLGMVLTDPKCHTLEINTFLRWLNRWGPTRVSNVCQEIGIRTNRCMGDLTDRQINELVHYMRL